MGLLMLANFQSAWNGIAKSMLLTSKPEIQQNPQVAREIKTKVTAASSHDSFVEAFLDI